MDNLHELMERCGLGKIQGEVLPVSGGLMHRMYRVCTETGTYAVKCLNPEIMKRPTARENFNRAECLERLLEKNGLPVVAAMEFDGKKMIELSGGFFYIFHWQEGSITDQTAISKEQCFRVGELLGRIHAIESTPVEASEAEVSTIDFQKLSELALEKGSPVAALVSEHLEELKDAEAQLNEARKALLPIRAITDDDMDPKNVMWYEGKPHIIDLECLDYGNPLSSCIELSLQWSGTVDFKFDKELLKAFFEGYLGVYDHGFRGYDKLFGIAYNWVSWLAYNIRRASGVEVTSEDEIRLGELEVKNTIERILYLKSIEGEIRSVLAEI